MRDTQALQIRAQRVKFGVAAMSFVVTVATAQVTDSALGPSANAHYTRASGSTIDDASSTLSTSASGGGGVTIGYGISRWFGIAMTADMSSSQAASLNGQPAAGSQALSQIDVAGRARIPLGGGTVIPYVLLGYSSRLLHGVLSGGATEDEWGPALTYGGGVEVFIARRWALDAAYLESTGTYARAQDAGGNGSNLTAGGTTSSRFLVGTTWHAGPLLPSSLAPSEDTISGGQRVRLVAGGATMMGTVAGVRSDTVVLQQVINDVARQVEIPRACIVKAERSTPSPSPGSSITKGAFVAAIGVSLVGVVINNTSKRAPPGTPEFFAKYALGGAALGGLVVWISGERDQQWQPLRAGGAASSVPADAGAACLAWKAPS